MATRLLATAALALVLAGPAAVAQTTQPPAGQPGAPGATVIDVVPPASVGEVGEIHAEPHTQKSGLPQLRFEDFAPQIFWLIVAFIVLYIAMSRVALPPVGRVLEDRARRIQGDLAEAEALRAQAQAAQAAYEKNLAEAHAAALAIVNEARAALTAQADKRKAELEARLGAEAREAEQRIQAARAAGLAEVRGVAADVAGAVVEKLLGRSAEPQVLSAAVDAAIAKGQS
ncbi:F0F1 ATP synthase subunit B family protein [Zavarzinia sp. CC-PAN008]|uniref:F0F1 ATP synthase subunit B family protein n=1 Tax=Zavarzinia sp. CC-PAN008 TaxID=3243332 RepID=UPI003F748537